MRRIAALVAILVALVAGGLLRSSEAASGDVIFLHGWNGSASSWNTAKAQYESAGFTVHVLSLPRAGGSAGDTQVNADYVRAYIASNGLTNVKLVGHSLGGTLAVYLSLGCSSASTCSGSYAPVSSVVMLDSGYGGFGCWLVPDLCSNSTVMTRIKSFAPTALPIIDIRSENEAYPHADCIKVYAGMGHNTFQTDSSVLADSIAWPGTNPCAGTPTPTATPTPTPTPCSWWDRLLGRC